jgi:hypothetical protein
MEKMVTDSIVSKKIITFMYDGLQRRAEPYTYGIHRDTGNKVLSCFQTDGFSNSGELPGWRLYLISEIRELAITTSSFSSPRSGYNPHDTRMKHIYATASFD